MPGSEELLNSTVARYVDRMDNTSSYDFLGRDMLLENGQTVDVLLYSHDSYTVECIGIYGYRDELGADKKEYSDRWTSYFLGKGFSNIRRRLRTEEGVSESYYVEEEVEGDYFIPTDTDGSRRKEIEAAVSDLLALEPFTDHYDSIDPNKLNI